MADIAATMKIQGLEADLRTRATQVSMLNNLLEQIVVALEEDDYDEALRLAKGEG